jgi:hypothetical protein
MTAPGILNGSYRADSPSPHDPKLPMVNVRSRVSHFGDGDAFTPAGSSCARTPCSADRRADSQAAGRL